MSKKDEKKDQTKNMPIKKQGILAEGEVTGHAHRVDAEVKALDALTRAFRSDDTMTITHEEHKAVSVPAGDYLSGQVVEFDPVAEMERAVRD